MGYMSLDKDLAGKNPAAAPNKRRGMMKKEYKQALLVLDQEIVWHVKNIKKADSPTQSMFIMGLKQAKGLIKNLASIDK